ncbi:hypothetical protein [Pseudomonas sp. Tri1]|uniref:hypothetical protein n=1 Tax=Pseudomonas sp. Tri1 TaxID=2823875 RepID=UPI001B32F876|nr:hypothetical protein [Pseudomonas sp. Tri1]
MFQRLPTVTFERHDQDCEDQLDSEVSFVIGQNEAALPAPCRVVVFYPREKRNLLDGLIALLQTASSQVERP